MARNVRREQRQVLDEICDVTWQDQGVARSVEVRAQDISESGMLIDSAEELPAGRSVVVQSRSRNLYENAIVRHCTSRGRRYRIGLEFKNASNRKAMPPAGDQINHYEVLQISPKAEMETIRRVYHMMAARFHPDNPETGDVEKFLLLERAYNVLSNPERRAEFDAVLEGQKNEPLPIFELKDFVEGVQGEANRRLGIMSLLYNQRRTDPRHPGVSLLALEKRMAFPREHLDFTIWYLKSKQYVTVEDNSDFILTAEGVDFVESNAPNNAILTRLLTGRHDAVTPPPQAPAPRSPLPAVKRLLPFSGRKPDADLDDDDTDFSS